MSDQTTNTTQNSENGANLQAEVALDIPQSGNEAGAGFRANERSRTSSALAEMLATPQGKMISTTLLTVLVVLGLIFLAITPAFSSINSQLEKNEFLRTRNQQLETKVNSLLTLQTKEQNLAEQLAAFDSLLGQDKFQDEIYTELVTLARQNNMTFRSMRFDEASTNASNYEDLVLSPRARFQRISFVAVGDINNAINLVGAIEDSKRIFDIDDIAIVEPQSENEVGVQLDINLRAMYWAATDE